MSAGLFCQSMFITYIFSVPDLQYILRKRVFDKQLGIYQSRVTELTFKPFKDLYKYNQCIGGKGGGRL